MKSTFIGYFQPAWIYKKSAQIKNEEIGREKGERQNRKSKGKEKRSDKEKQVKQRQEIEEKKGKNGRKAKRGGESKVDTIQGRKGEVK